MKYADFVAYWARNEEKMRSYARRRLSSLPDCEDVVTEALLTARAEIAVDLDGVKSKMIFSRFRKLLKTFAPPHSFETFAVIELLWESGEAPGYEGGTPEEVRDFLKGYHYENLHNEEPYHPAVKNINLDAVNWMEVALEVMA